jgi:glycylpeptide N-tetradecanoyltransferase
MQRMQRLYRLPAPPSIAGFRPMRASAVPSVTKGLGDFLKKFALRPHLDEEEVRHGLVPRGGVIDAFVGEAPSASSSTAAGEGSGATITTAATSSSTSSSSSSSSASSNNIVALVSFYHLPSTVIGNTKHKDLRASYLYYYFTSPGGPSIESLVTDAMVEAKARGVDVFNALDLLDNGPILEALKFGIGDGNLQYYLYNWACPSMEAKNVGLVLL